MLHRNPDLALVGVTLAEGSFTEGVKVEANGTFIAHEIGVACVTSSALANVAANALLGANQVIVQADGQDVRYRLDVTAPTAALGVLIKNGTSVPFNMADALALRFIQVSATALVNATYTM